MKMKPETVTLAEVPNEGLVKLIGQTVTLFCNYFYTGVLVGVNDDCVLLSGTKIIYETGPWETTNWTRVQALPGTGELYVMRRHIEAFAVFPSKK